MESLVFICNNSNKNKSKEIIHFSHHCIYSELSSGAVLSDEEHKKKVQTVQQLIILHPRGGVAHICSDLDIVVVEDPVDVTLVSLCYLIMDNIVSTT